MAKLREVVRQIAAGVKLHLRHRNHALIGPWQSSRDCHVEPDSTLIYTIDKDTLRLERTGTHSDLFRR